MKRLYNREKIYNHLNYCLENKIEDDFYYIWDTSGILQGEEEKANMDEIGQKPLYDMNRYGGVLVTNIGDISYVHLVKRLDRFNWRFCNYLIKKLKEKGIEARYTKNDLLINDKFKFMGEMTKKINDYYFVAGHISFNVLTEEIQKICNKPQEKIPCGLSNWGIRTEEVEEWLLEFFNLETKKDL